MLKTYQFRGGSVQLKYELAGRDHIVLKTSTVITDKPTRDWVKMKLVRACTRLLAVQLHKRWVRARYNDKSKRSYNGTFLFQGYYTAIRRRR